MASSKERGSDLEEHGHRRVRVDGAPSCPKGFRVRVNSEASGAFVTTSILQSVNLEPLLEVEIDNSIIQYVNIDTCFSPGREMFARVYRETVFIYVYGGVDV
jgi:hypothetical protein